MKRWFAAALALAFALLAAPWSVAQVTEQAARQDAAPPAASARLVLVMLRLPPQHFRPDSAYSGGYLDDGARAARRRIASDVAQAHGLRLRDQWPMPVIGVDCFLMEQTDGAPTGRVLEALAHDTRVAWAQRLEDYQGMDGGDPLYPVQPAGQAWHLADLHRVSTGRNVTVAVIDSGVDVRHPDLAGQVSLWRNFVDDRADAPEAHGTAVAGIIAARAGNGIGIAGVAPQAHVMALRACWEGGGLPTRCNSLTLAKAINYAIEHGANIMNLSLAGPPDRLLQSLIEAALARGVTVVGAADPVRPDGGFPASQPGVIAVARAGEAHSLTPPALIAPGTDVPTCLPGERWGMVSGSSYAAAHVTGLVALLAEVHPREGPGEMRRHLDGARLAQSTPPAAIDACDALAHATNACVCLCPTRLPTSARPSR